MKCWESIDLLLRLTLTMVLFHWNPDLQRVVQNHCLSVSVRSAFFFRNWSYYFFLIFCTIFDNRSIWKLTELPGKFIFVQIWAKGPKVDFWIFWKILSLVFFGNNLKWKLILLLIFHHQSQVYFWHAGKHRSFLQVDTIILSVRNQGCSKHSK